MTNATTDFTFEHLANFSSYEDVRAEGLYNMFDPRAQLAAGLSKDEYAFVMQNYTELKASYEADRAA